MSLKEQLKKWLLIKTDKAEIKRRKSSYEPDEKQEHEISKWRDQKHKSPSEVFKK